MLASSSVQILSELVQTESQSGLLINKGALDVLLFFEPALPDVIEPLLPELANK